MTEQHSLIRQAGRIAVLPLELANQIAAGEVVERPASVVKELVENAIDAEATAIDVRIEAGGLKRMAIMDNGHGMSRDEARLAVERHATSKIRAASDLYAIASLGFRGEALPSIASVSRMSLVTRRPEDLEGTRVEIDGGLVEGVKPVACPVGTEVVVADLFYNTPARLKFLKGEQSERRHIVDILARLALGQPQVYLRLISEGTVHLDAPPSPDPRERASSVLGARTAQNLYPIQAMGEVEDLQLGGLFSNPELARRDSGGIYIYVNGRYVRDKKIQAAISMAYAGLLDRGLYPVVVLNLTMPPRQVDVNVHPTKAEVRFGDPDLVFKAVRRAMLDSLAGTPWVPQGSRPVLRSYTLKEAAGDLLAGPLAVRPMATEPLRPGPGSADGGFQQVLPGTTRSTLDEAGLGGWWSSPERRLPSGAGAAEAGNYFSSLRFIGQLGRTYLLCQDEEGLVVVDQHASHERILFERLKDLYAGHHRQVQNLLLPVQIELDRSQQATLEEYKALFERCGFEIEAFSAGSAVIRSVPAVLVGSHYERLVRESLDELANVGHSQRLDEAIDALLSRMACHGSVRGGDRMAAQQVEALMVQLDGIDFRAACPHGRPVFFRLSWSEIEKRFQRQ